MFSSLLNEVFASRTRLRSIITTECGLMVPLTVGIQQLRGRKRNLKRQLSKQEKLERRLKREAREAERKKYTFMQRIKISRMKSMVSISEQYPGRLIAEKESHLPDTPITNIFIRSDYKTQYCTVSEALAMHREMQHPSIYNNPDARVRLRMELNMTTEKKTKMVAESEEIVPIPYSFKHNEKRTILAFAHSQDNRDLAVEAGAEISLGPDMIRKIIRGQFRIDDYDFCVAHSDMAASILPLRGVLKSRFPNKINGGLGDDLREIIAKFRDGVKVKIRGDPTVTEWGLCDTIVGRLSMADFHLEDNISAVIAAVCKHRSPALGPFINRALMMVVPGEAFFPLQISKYTPVASEEELEKLEKRVGKKKKKASGDAQNDEAFQYQDATE